MKKVLDNKNIVLTRAESQAKNAIALLENLGANVISFPTVKFSQIIDPKLNNVFVNLSSFDSIIFTSENAVKYFLLKIAELNVIFQPEKFFIISIGEKTSATCKLNNIQINFQPSKFSWEYLTEQLSDSDLNKKNIFIPCSNLSEPSKYKQLEKFGAKVTVLPIYRNDVNDMENLDKEIKLLQNTEIDVYIFTSPSTFNGFLKILNITEPAKYFNNKNIAVIGPVTEKRLHSFGVFPNIKPDNFSIEHLVEAIKKFYQKEVINN
jgi:uroporphyrinogen-III synthase